MSVTRYTAITVFRGPCIAVPHCSAMNGCVFRTLEKQDLVHPAPVEPPPPFSLCIKDALLALPVALRSPLLARRAVSTLPSQLSVYIWISESLSKTEAWCWLPHPGLGHAAAFWCSDSGCINFRVAEALVKSQYDAHKPAVRQQSYLRKEKS